jgi:hypothetical protein
MLSSKASPKIKFPWKNLVIVIAGGLITAGSFLLVRNTLLHWKNSDLFYRYFAVFAYALGVCVGITLILFPVSKNKIVGIFLQVIWFPFVLLVRISRLYNIIAFPYIAFSGIVTFLLIFLGIFSSLHILPKISDKASLYFTFSFTFLLFTFWGRDITRFLINLLKVDVDKDRLYSLLQPAKVRIFVYGLMAVSYILANLEKFAAITIIPLAGWSVYKDVIVEILLTYVAIDSLIETWKDLKEK